MDKKKDIYYDGRIYVGVDVDTDIFSTSHHLVNYLDSKYTSYPVHVKHSFTDGMDVTGKCELQCKYGGKDCAEIGGHKCTIVALPLSSASEQPDGIDLRILDEQSLQPASEQGEKDLFNIIHKVINPKGERQYGKTLAQKITNEVCKFYSTTPDKIEVWKDMLIEYKSLDAMEENDWEWNIKILMESYNLSKAQPTPQQPEHTVQGKEVDEIIEHLYEVFANWYQDDGIYDTFLKSEAMKAITKYASQFKTPPQ